MHKNVSISSSREDVAIIERGSYVGHSSIEVVMHVDGPVGIQGREGVGLWQGVNTYTAIGGPGQKVLPR